MRQVANHSLAAVTLELKTHEVYRGYLDEVEDNWNLHITNITRTEVGCSLALPVPFVWSVLTGFIHSVMGE